MSKLSFKMKIMLMIGTALVALLIMAVTSLLQERRLITESRKELLTTAVQSAHSIVAAYQAKAASGAMPQEEAQKAAKDALRIARYGGPEGKTEYFYIWTTEGVGVMHPFKPEWDGQNMLGKVKDGSGVDIIALLVNGMRSSKDGKAFVPTMFARPNQTTPVPKLQYIVRVDGWNWMVGSGLYTDDVDMLLRKALLSSLAMVVVVILVVGAIGLFVSRSVLRQIGGEPTDAIAIMSEVAEGNLDTHIPTAHPGSMLDGLAHMVTSLRKLVTDVRAATDSIATASSEIAQGNNDLAHRTEDTASNLQSTASSMEELTSTVKQTSDSAQTANQMATSAAAVAARGGEVVSRVVATMQDINASSNKISDIIGVIDGIAFQTNILALNAAVEAARAWRARPGLCRGGQRGAQPGRTQCRSRQGDQGPDWRVGRKGGIGHAAGGQCGRHHDRDRGKRSARDRHHWRNPLGHIRAEPGHCPGQHGHEPARPDDAAELCLGGAIHCRRRQSARAGHEAHPGGRAVPGQWQQCPSAVPDKPARPRGHTPPHTRSRTRCRTTPRTGQGRCTPPCVARQGPGSGAAAQGQQPQTCSGQQQRRLGVLLTPRT